MYLSEMLSKASEKPVVSADVQSEFVNYEVRERLKKLQEADPDPYGHHKLSLEHRMAHIEHFLLTGERLV
jgi:thiamine phosphate synthase YjbQ (UPF0047 family)